MLAVEGVSKRYGPHIALEDVTLGVSEGEIVGLLGPNGAGKTTLMRVATGILGPDSGHVTIGGRAPSERSARRNVGYLPELPALYPEMRADAFVAYFARLRDVPRRGLRDRVRNVLDSVGAGALATRRCGALSRGQRQAVGLAQALVHDPSLLLLDEPAAGLDPGQSSRLRGALRELATTKAVLLSTHLLSEVKGLCDRVVVLSSGRVIAEGRPDELALQELLR